MDIFVPEMSTQSLISALKPRSGQQLKLACNDIIKLDSDQESYSLCLFSGKEGKIGVLLRTSNLETLKLTTSKSYSVKNLQYHEEKSGVPVFKLLKQSVFRESSLACKEHKKFTKNEIDSLKTINAEEYYDAHVQLKESQPAKSTSSSLSLVEFITTDPRHIKDYQYVEVGDAL